jgi:hypothetical protein
VLKYYGFDFPPVGVINILNRLAPKQHVFYILDPISGVELPYDELDSNCWVVITTNEGSSHCWFDQLIPKLQLHGVPLSQIVIRSSCLWDPESPVKHIHTILDECSDFITLVGSYVPKITSPTHHYVCLNNSHRWQRYQLVKQLLDKNLDKFGKISYLETPGNDSRFPIIIEKSKVSWQEQRNLKIPELTGALLNVIAETAYEPDPESAYLTNHHRPGMTEKSYKCFALFQLPIWLAPYKAVSCYRNLGFDVFDDIIDHEYDLESNPIQRITLIVQQIQKFCQLPLNSVADLKLKLQPRFEKNWQVLNSYAHNFNTEIPQWKALFTNSSVYKSNDC